MSTEQKPVINERIYVRNVDFKATEDEIKELFDGLKVTEVDIPSKEYTRGSKTKKRNLGFAFVQFETEEDADKAIETVNGKEFKGRNVFIKKATPPPTEEEKKARAEKYHAKQEEIRKAKAEKKAEKIEAIKAKQAEAKAAKAADKENGEVDAKDKVPEGVASSDTIFITNLDYKANVQTLSKLFKDLKPKWIHVPTVRVPYYKKKGKNFRPTQNKGIAFVKFASEEIQQQAVKEFNGKEINGREIIIDIAVDTRKDTEKKESETAAETATETAAETPAETPQA